MVKGKSGPLLSPFETVIGRDERVRILDTELPPWRMMCALRMRGPGGAGAIGTGWFIGPRRDSSQRVIWRVLGTIEATGTGRAPRPALVRPGPPVGGAELADVAFDGLHVPGPALGGGHFGVQGGGAGDALVPPAG
jgi:hypothetical protein